LVNLIREIVKDIQDIEGDSKLNYKTFPILFGITKSKHLITIVTIFLILSTLYPFITRLYNIEYLIIIMILVNPLLILCLKFLYDPKWNNKLNTLSNFYKLNMIFGLAAIYFGK
ncbi:MAG TPA: UbiA family prenyltransferase, partial [Ignavibacteriaceae bacterium]